VPAVEKEIRTTNKIDSIRIVRFREYTPIPFIREIASKFANLTALARQTLKEKKCTNIKIGIANSNKRYLGYKNQINI